MRKRIVTLVAVVAMLIACCSISQAATIPNETWEMPAQMTDVDGNELGEEFYLYRSTLDDKYKELYDYILDALYDLKETIPLSRKDIGMNIKDIGLSEFQSLFIYVMRDHPEIFWVTPDNYTGLAYPDGTPVSLYVDCNMTARNIPESTEQFVKRAQPILNFASKLPTDADKVKAVHDYMLRTVEPVYGAEANQSAYSAIVNGQAYDSGYARGFQYLMQKLGIPATCVTGTAVTGGVTTQSHTWNLVKLDGDYYNVDVTWDDPENRPLDAYVYTYFNVPDAQMTDHSRDAISRTLPTATGTRYTLDNHFEGDKTGTDFTGYEQDAVVALRPGSHVQLEEIDGEQYVLGHDHPVTVAALIEDFSGAMSARLDKQVLDVKGEVKENDAMVATGDTIRLTVVDQPVMDGHVVITGDVAGTGTTSGITQLVRMAEALKGEKPLDGAFLLAGDFTGNGKIDTTDLVQAVRFMNSQDNAVQPEPSTFKPGLYATFEDGEPALLFISQSQEQKDANRLEFSAEWLDNSQLQHAEAEVNGNVATFEANGLKVTLRMHGDEAISFESPDLGPKTLSWQREERWRLSDDQLKKVAAELDVPEDMEVTFKQGTSGGAVPSYSMDENCYYVHVYVFQGNRNIASASVDPITLEQVRSVSKYVAPEEEEA